MDLHIYAEVIASRRGVPTDAVLCFAEALVGIECAGDVEYALDVASLVSGPLAGNDAMIDKMIAEDPGARRRTYGA